MTWKPQRRQRWEGLSTEQSLLQAADDLDLLDGVLEEHIEEDMAAHTATAKAMEEWRLDSYKRQNRLLITVALTLLTALISVVVTLATMR